MGNDEQGQLVLYKSDLVRLEFKKDGYFEGQLVEGSLILKVDKEIKLDEVLIRIRMIQSFNILQSKNNEINNFYQKKIFLKKINLPYIFKSNKPEDIILQPGTRNIPFRFFFAKKYSP
jgi:hypothetical protein